ncbi:hypothetical protein [Actinacidiphila paucisporea]|uniref:hypothetical protein n=1 Tax=Actinacidiphila paucisporea TaxID=310782 RepID=UPI00116120E8|nr:hypothetical protein [Actinacidiphila paucisporea]
MPPPRGGRLLSELSTVVQRCPHQHRTPAARSVRALLRPGEEAEVDFADFWLDLAGQRRKCVR